MAAVLLQFVFMTLTASMGVAAWQSCAFAAATIFTTPTLLSTVPRWLGTADTHSDSMHAQDADHKVHEPAEQRCHLQHEVPSWTTTLCPTSPSSLAGKDARLDHVLALGVPPQCTTIDQNMTLQPLCHTIHTNHAYESCLLAVLLLTDTPPGETAVTAQVQRVCVDPGNLFTHCAEPDGHPIWGDGCCSL
eukprot:264465-Amphidinium_carterae.1